jgi:ferrochelatase
MVATPEKQQKNLNKTESNTDRVAVLLMGYGEVEDYENFGKYNTQALNLLTAKFAPIPSWATPVFAQYLANADRKEWEQEYDGFISPHNEIFERQRAGVEQHLQQRWGSRVGVFKAFNFCEPFLPEQVLAQIKAQGFNKLLVYPLLVVDSIFTSGIAIEQVNNGLKELGDSEEHWLNDSRYIPSFYDRPAYIDLVAQLVEEKIEEQQLRETHLPSQIGIVLMNHGCPEEAKGFVTGIRESQALYEGVREKLINRYPLISVGWLNHDTPFVEWTQPDADRAGEILMELGATAVLFVPMGFATDNHETILDVESIIEQLRRKRPNVTYVRANCVNDRPEFLKMVADWANPQIESLLSTKAPAVSPGLQPEMAQTHSHGHEHHH